MPTYCFRCPVCNEYKDVFRTMSDFDSPKTCDCGVEMTRLLADPRRPPSVRGDYKKPIISTSMAFNTQDVDKHRRRFPGVDLKIDKAGHTAYPILRSLSQKKAYTKARGWMDCNAFS